MFKRIIAEVRELHNNIAAKIAYRTGMPRRQASQFLMGLWIMLFIGIIAQVALFIPTGSATIPDNSVGGVFQGISGLIQLMLGVIVTITSLFGMISFALTMRQGMTPIDQANQLMYHGLIVILVLTVVALVFAAILFAVKNED